MIRIETKLTFREYLKLVYRLNLRSPLSLIVLCIIAVVALVICIPFAQGKTTVEEFAAHTLFPLGLLLYYVIRLYFHAKKQYRAIRAIQGQIAYEFDTAGIKAVSGISNTEISWESIDKVVELKGWVLIYKKNKSAFMIPKADFGSQLSDFRALVRNAGVRAKLRD